MKKWHWFRVRRRKLRQVCDGVSYDRFPTAELSLSHVGWFLSRTDLQHRSPVHPSEPRWTPDFISRVSIEFFFPALLHDIEFFWLTSPPTSNIGRKRGQQITLCPSGFLVLFKRLFLKK
jgi:hypothetical protein